MSRILGVDISDISTTLAYYNEEKIYKYPTIICKEKDNDRWSVGEEAYECLLAGTGSISDKLLTMTDKNHFINIEGLRYYGVDLLQMYLSILIDNSLEDGSMPYPEKIVVSIPTINADLVDKIITCFINLGYRKNNILVISRAESFIYYTLSKSKDIWNNQVALFDLSNQNFVYYELKMQRLARTSIVYVDSRKMEESINIDLLTNHAGAKLVDKILTDAAKELIAKKVFSSILLTGKGFEKPEWAEDFLNFACNRRKVLYDGELFAKGASVKAVELDNGKNLFNIVCICDGRLNTGVDINIEKDNKISGLSLVKAGDTWYNNSNEFKFIADSINDIELTLLPIEQRRKKIVRVNLDFLPVRANKTRRIDIKTSFKDARTLVLDISDDGFGDFYKKTDAKIVHEVDLWD